MSDTPRPTANWSRQRVEGVSRVIAVASGKGGVGKSTLSAALAVTLAQMNVRVGLLDADIYGPSQTRIMKLSGKPELDRNGKMIPPISYGVPCMSIGLLVEDAPAVLRGPMIGKTLQQLLRGTRWATEHGPLDILLLDLPPGTGDVQLSLAQQVEMGAVIVTTPQQMAVMDAKKALQMFQKVDVPVLGVIENMAGYATPDRNLLPFLGEGGGKALAQNFDVHFLGALPFHPDLAAAFDAGHADIVTQHAAASNLRAIAQAILKSGR